MHARTALRTGCLALLALAACGSSSPDGALDAAIDAPPDAAINKTTSVAVSMMATRTLNLGIYGVNADDGTLHVEINLGGITTCPDMNSPTPDYTLVLGRVPSNSEAGLTPGNFLDYKGDMLPGGALGQAASQASVSGIVYTVGTFVTFEANATFPAGTAMGHVYATYCASLDG